MSDAQYVYRCNDCGHRWHAQIDSCPQCGSPNLGRLFFVNLGGTITPTGTLEGVADSVKDDIHKVQYLSPSGGRADSILGPSGVDLTLRAPIDIGKRGEQTVTNRVVAQLRAEGHVVTDLAPVDARGEDRRITCDGQEVTLQVVGIPAAPGFIGAASRGSASTSVTLFQAAEWIQDVVQKKKDLYAPPVRTNMLLAVDARAVGVLVSPAITEQLKAQQGTLCEHSGFGAIWVVGPSDSRCTRLPGSRW